MQNPPVGGNTTKPPEQYTLPPVYTAPAPVAPEPPRYTPPSYTPPSYTPPRTIDRSDAPQLEARKGPARPKDTPPDYSGDDWRDKTPRDIGRERDLARERDARDANRDRKGAVPVQPRVSEDYADDRNSPILKQKTD